MRTGIGIHLVVEVDCGMKYGMVVGMGCSRRLEARGRSGRIRRDIRLVLGASFGVESCVGIHNLRKRRVRGSSRSSGAVLTGVGYNTSRLVLGYGDESWAYKCTLSLINSE